MFITDVKLEHDVISKMVFSDFKEAVKTSSKGS